MPKTSDFNVNGLPPLKPMSKASRFLALYPSISNISSLLSLSLTRSKSVIMKVTILSKEVIVPCSPTPCELKIYKLCYIDQMIQNHHIPFILYYAYDESTAITQSKITTKLKTSLSKTLTRFYPLAGRLTDNKNAIDCNDQGVRFAVARVDCNLMNIVKTPPIEELKKLVLMEPSSSSSSYVEEQVAFQVNLFDCGGIAIGVYMSHKIADACSFSLFVKHWFATAKGTESLLTDPVLDSAVLLPPLDSYESRRTGPPLDPFKNLVTKRFVFSSLAIKELKHKVIQADTTHPTRVEVVTALIWKCMAAASGCKASVAFHVVNFRRKMVPPLKDLQFGNLFQMTGAAAEEMTDMGCLVGKVRGSFEKIDGEYLKSLMGENGVEIVKGNFGEIGKYIGQEGVGVFRFSSWCRFAVNESDFGWGKPVWISITDFNSEHCTIFMDSRMDDGIEAWVVMNEDNMKKLEQDAELQAFLGTYNTT